VASLLELLRSGGAKKALHEAFVENPSAQLAVEWWKAYRLMDRYRTAKLRRDRAG
jgi:hypothetical protein